MPDPYEHGFEVAQRRRLDLPDLDAPLPQGPRVRRPPRISWKVLLGALAVVVLIAVGRAASERNATSLKADCTRMRLAIGEKSVPSRTSSLLHWAATGSGRTRYVVAIDPVGSRSHGQATPPQTMPDGCLAHGQFGVLVPPGRYDVTLYRVDGVEQPVARQPLTVTRP